MRSFRWTVRGVRVVGLQHRPLACRCKRLVAARQYGRNVRCFVDLLVEDRAVEPDDVLDVVLDFGGIELVQRPIVGRKMAVRERLIVTRPRLMDVLRRQR